MSEAQDQPAPEAATPGRRIATGVVCSIVATVATMTIITETQVVMMRSSVTESVPDADEFLQSMFAYQLRESFSEI